VSRNVVAATVTQRARRAGTSGYTIAKMWGVFGNLLFNNSSLLLRVAGQAGVLFAMLSFIAAGWVIYRRLAHQVAVAGWASLLVVNLLLGGLTLIAIGIIGEYLIRVIEIGENRPAYHVRRRVNGADAAPRERR
jgi:glycosyltransferase involved in cell wall biosynthesis